MGQDDGVTRAPGGTAIALPSPARPREPLEQAAPGAAASASLLRHGSGTPMKAAAAGGSAVSSPAAVDLELQQLRKDAQESRRWATEVEQSRIKCEEEYQSQINSLRAQARLLEEKVALRDRQLDQRREEAKAALEKQDREFAKQRDALVAKCLELGAKDEDLSSLLASTDGDAGDAAAGGPTPAELQTELEEARKRIRTLEEEVEEHAANINRLTLREREARNEVGVVRALLARGGDFYPEILPVKRMGYVDYVEVKRALEEGRVVKQNSCSQPTVEKALERVRQAILDPSVDVLLRADGHVVGEDRAHVQLRNLASEFGEPLVDLVLAKKREVEQYNSSGNYIVPVLFSQGREMPLDAAVRRLFLAVRKYREALDRKRVSCDIEAEDLERAEDRLSQQEEDDFLFFRSTGARASTLPISASPWTPTANSSSASAAAAGGAAPLPSSSAAASIAVAGAPLSRATPEQRAPPQPNGKAGGRGSGGEGTGGFSSALLDRFVAHILAHKRQAATAQDYRVKADEFVVMWLQRLPAAARPLGPIGEEAEFRRLYKKHRDTFIELFKNGRAQTSSERSRNSAVRYMMQYMGLADDNPIFYPWGRAPQSSSGSVASSSSAASTASGGSAPKQKKAQMETAQAGVAGVEEVLELGRLRLRIGAPLTPALQRGFITWVIDRQECSRVEEAAVQVDVLQRLFRQVLAVREFKLWRASLRAGSEAVEGGPLDLCLAPGSLADKGTVREVVAEANLKDVIRDEGTPEEQVAMALLSHWLADAGDTLHRLQGGAAYDSEGSSDDEGDVFGSKRKRKRLSTGKASPSFHSPSRRTGLTDGMKIRFSDWLLANKDMNRDTAEAYAGRLTSLVGKLLGEREGPLGTMEATRAFYERAMPVALKELTPARTPVQKRMCRIWRFFSEFVGAPDKGRGFNFGPGATPTSSCSNSSSKPASASAGTGDGGALAPLGGDFKQEVEGGA